MSPEIVKKRWLRLLILQLISSTLVYLLFSPLTRNPFLPSLWGLFTFSTFHLSLLLFFSGLAIITSPEPSPAASILELVFGMTRFTLFLFLNAGLPENLFPPSFRQRARTSLSFVFFAVSCLLSGFLSLVSVCGRLGVFDESSLVGVGLAGAVFGAFYGVLYVKMKRWVLSFPIVQRHPFYSFKMGLLTSFKHALLLPTIAFPFSMMAMWCMRYQLKIETTPGQFIFQQIAFYIGTCAVSFCWELSHHLRQVMHTRRLIFAPPQGSAAAETNPSEPLLSTLEQSIPRSLLQYLAYLDLCMVCESNADSWRRAAFFEETGETYKRVVSVSLRPLEQLTSMLSEGLEGGSIDKTDFLSQQLASPIDRCIHLRLREISNDFQLCAWCARAVSALTARSHREDRYGVAQLTGSNTTVISTLLSCLLAVEACMGKKTSPQPPHMMGPANIKWATVDIGRRDGLSSATSGKRGGGALHSKAFAMADVLRTSIYEIVSVFHDEMVARGKPGIMENVWITRSKPLYGTRDVLIQKLSLFLDFRAT